MKGRTARQLAINTLSHLSVIGFGLGLFEGRAMPFILAALAYGIAFILAKEADND